MSTAALGPGSLVWAALDRHTMRAEPWQGRGAEVLQVASVSRLDWRTSLVRFTVGATAEVSRRAVWTPA